MRSNFPTPQNNDSLLMENRLTFSENLEKQREDEETNLILNTMQKRKIKDHVQQSKTALPNIRCWKGSY